MRKLVRSAEGAYLILLLAAFVGPLVTFLAKVAPWKQLGDLAQTSIWTSVQNSMVLMTITSVLSTGFAVVFLWVLWRFRWPHFVSRPLTLLLKVPYLLPPFFIAMGWIGLAAPGVGYLNLLLARIGLPQLPSIYGMVGTVFVLVLWTASLAMIQLQGFFDQFSGELEDAAIMCGATPARTFVSITLPLARPYLISCALLTAVSALSAFGVPGLLGTPNRTFVLTTKILQAIKGSFDFGQAGLLSLVLLFITLVLLGIRRVVFGDRAQDMALGTGRIARPSSLRPGRGAQALAAVAVVFGTFSFVLPSIAIALRALLRDPSDFHTWSVERFAYVFGGLPEGLNAVKNSLITASTASLVVASLGLIVAYGASRMKLRTSRYLIEAWDVGYALPGSIIALTLVVFFAGTITDTLWILSLAYAVKFAAFSLRTLTPALGSIPRQAEEAAWMSGASPVRAFFGILVPWLKPAIAAAVILTFVPMLCELTMSVMLIGPGTETLGTLIYRFQEYADPGSAAALAMSVAAATFSLNFVMRRFSKGRFGI